MEKFSHQQNLEALAKITARVSVVNLQVIDVIDHLDKVLLHSKHQVNKQHDYLAKLSSQLERMSSRYDPYKMI